MLQMTETKFGDSKRWDSNPHFFIYHTINNSAVLAPQVKGMNMIGRYFTYPSLNLLTN